MGRKGLPMKLLISKAIKTIRGSGKPELQEYADRLNVANDKSDMDEVAKILSELATRLQGYRTGVKM